MRDAMAEAARAKPPPPRSKMWIWWVVLGAGVLALLAQLLGLTTSPVEDKLRRNRPPAQDPGTSSPR